MEVAKALLEKGAAIEAKSEVRGPDRRALTCARVSAFRPSSSVNLLTTT